MLRLFSVRACESSGFPLKLTPMEIENLLTSCSSIVLVCRAVVDNLRWSIATESTSDIEFQKLLQAGPKKRRVGWTEDLHPIEKSLVLITDSNRLTHFAAGSDFKDGGRVASLLT